MVAVACVKFIAGEAAVQLLLQSVQKLVDGEHGIIRLVAGVDGRDLFVPDEYQRLGLEMAEEGVQYLGKLILRELGQTVAADLGAIQKAFVGGVPHGVELAVAADGKTQVVESVLHSGLAGAGGKGGESGEVACAPDEGLYMELVDSAAGPETSLAEILVIAVDLGEAGEGGGITVLTILHFWMLLSVYAVLPPVGI